MTPAADAPLESLHTEAARGNLRAVRELVESRSPTKRKDMLERTDEFGDTPMIKACRRGHTEVAECLLQHGANLDARNEDGYTPLMLACYWEQLGVVQMLLRQGADTSLASHNGRTCFDTARSDSVRALLATGSAPARAAAAVASEEHSSPLPHAALRSPFLDRAPAPQPFPPLGSSFADSQPLPATETFLPPPEPPKPFDTRLDSALLASAGAEAAAGAAPASAAPPPISSSVLRDLQLPDFRSGAPSSPLLECGLARR